METQKTKELRVRLRRVIRSSSGKLRPGLPRTNKTALSDSSSSDSESDDFATVHFKLAAALEAAAAHGLSFDWESMKSAVISEAKSAFKAKESDASAASTSTSSSAEQRAMSETVVDSEQKDGNASAEQQLGAAGQSSAAAEANPMEKRESFILHERESSTTSSSGEDGDVDEITDRGVTFIPPELLLDVSSTDDDDNDGDVPDIISLVSPEPPGDAAMQLSRLSPFTGPGVSVVDDTNPTAALSKILALPPFDPHAPQLQVQLAIKSIVSLAQLSLREDNEIEVEIKKSRIVEYSKGAISKKDGALSPIMDFSNIHVKHCNEEFFTFCSCKKCVEYREIVVHIMVEQFKAAHMVVMLLDVLIKVYGPMLKNVTAYNKFEKLLDANKEIYWITCGFVYNKKAEHLDFIYDESLSDNMIFVLFSSILMVNNPLLLLQILSFHVECIVRAYAEGFLEIVEPDNNKIPAEEMLTYILDGYDDLCRISEQISCYLFAFENDFLRKFSLTWTLLCQRLYQQHVYLNLTDTMLACIITLKEDELTSRHAALIKKYIQFDDKMNYVDKRWTDVWIELNKFNLSEAERKRRKYLLNVYRIFDTVVQDAIAFSLQESGDDNDFYDFQSLENRRLAWQNIMAYTKMKWPDGFFDPPNTMVCDDKCKKCSVMLEYHVENCKCITCSIAGGPLPPRRNPDNTCYKCLAHSLVEKEVNFYESKILNVCASDDFLSFVKNNGKRKSTTLEELGEEVSATVSVEDNCADVGAEGSYHVAWTVFHHFNTRKRYRHDTIEDKYFCSDCELPACLLARKILNNEIAQTLAQHLIRYYQPLSMSREELRAILPNIMLYNRKMIASNIGLNLTDVHDLVVKIYWTFIISLYATYFMEFDDKSTLNLDLLEISNNDIRLRMESLVGNKDDTKFVEFLDKIKSLSPFKNQVESDFAFTVDVHTEEIQNKLDSLLNIHEKHHNPPSNENIPPPVTNAVDSAPTLEGNPKKNCKEKSKKCCFDHSDLGDHCKENHSSKKRIKKECNHARMNETRDRLRKKLSQLVNARKNMKTPAEPLWQGTQTPSTAKQQSLLKSSATAAAACSNVHSKAEDEDDSLECLSTLCKRISHLHTNQKSNGNANSSSTATPNSGKKLNAMAAAAAPAKKQNNTNSSNNNNNLTKDIPAAVDAGATTSSNTTNPNNNSNVPAPAKRLSAEMNLNNVISAAAAAVATPNTPTTSKGANGLDMVSEIYEFLDNYSKDQSKVKKWINDTLSYIEGSGCNGNGKKQPQPTNPKKAAKKAKQKQRKEEEKRIIELHDLRAQFHDIYFKEFIDKHQLKSLKSSKKRDKKRIGELEANVKKLQRAKAKVESGILELIATVKQTNTDFKFPYLPTKEQQVEKIRAMDEHSAESNSHGADAAVQLQQQSPLHKPMTPTAATNNLNATTNIAAGNYSLPYAHANHFPYHIDFQGQGAGIGGAATAYGMIRPPLPTPMCYAPPQHQVLSRDVVAAMAANAACNSNVDPSKRIVTIRRVNLPNVPEPQVTVTAKGSSPDKDKLLYTFVNGQLVQTGTATPPPPMTQLPLNTLPLPVQSRAGNVPEHIIAIPPPPLTKTQLKKERRRQAKLAAEEAKEAADEAERLRQQQQQQAEEEEQMQRELKLTAKLTKGKGNDKKKKTTQATIQKETESMKGKTQKNTNNSSSTSGAEAAKQTAFQRRSNSTTTSCSAGTSTSATPMSSQVNTRENSVCSQKPAAAAPSRNISGKLEHFKETPKSQQPQKPQQQQQAQKKNKPPATKVAAKKSRTPTPPPATPEPITQPQPKPNPKSVTKVKRERNRRVKLVDSGQFDNNPYKSLHLQDSDSECDSATSYEDDTDGGQPEEPVLAKIPVVIPVMVQPKVVPPKRETKVQNKRVSATIAPKEADTRQTTPAPQMRESQIPNKVKTKSQILPHRTATNKQPAHGQQQPPQQQQQQQMQTRPPKQHTREVLNKSQQQPQQGRTRVPESVQHKATFSNKRGGTQGTRSECKPKAGTEKIHTNTESGGGGGGGGGSANGNNSQRGKRNSNRHQQQQQPQHEAAPNSTNAEGKPLSKRAQKQALRNKKFQKHQQHGSNHSSSKFDDCGAGIPNHMGYFNPNDVLIPPTNKQQQQHHQQQQQQQQYNSLAQQMQGLRLGQQHASYASISNNYQITSTNNSHKPISANVSIMDQLNRGVQVENLSLPPGITLTKVDPVKSEQLRQKSESIKKLSKPLQQQQQVNHNHIQQSFHHPGATIIAPPVASASSYYGAPYAGVAAAAALDQSGIIMVEANPPITAAAKHQGKPNVAAAAAAASNGKTSKNKKRRNKPKSDGGGGGGGGRGGGGGGNSMASKNTICDDGHQPKMVTLRNPMFNSGPAGAAASILQQQPGLIPGRPLGGMPLAPAAPAPVDQPAAIIKNENGMFTIRNPALHQAVTNGLAMGGYRQFGNVNYYTPQEAAAEAARATQETAAHAKAAGSATVNPSSSFSYFSSSANDAPAQDVSSNQTHNNISISCTSVAGSGGGLTGDAAVIARPTPQKCISAIGSEVKSALQQKQKSKESQWSNFVQDLPAAMPLNNTDNLACSSAFLSGAGGGGLPNAALQDKYQQSSYYNGFEVFPANNNSNQMTSSVGGRSSNTGSLFDGGDCHMHHNCGDESPPPTITGFNSYLEGIRIPNTGVIRYDDASFLKNLIPGQNLNNEVSIHNVNDSNFTRNTTSPVAHRVEITPVYSNRPTSTNIYEHCSTSGAAVQSQSDQQQKFVVNNYRENLTDYGNESNMFSSNNLLNLNELDAGGERDVDSFKRFNYDFEPTENQQAIIDLNELLVKKSSHSHSHRTSPYLDEARLDNFVQNINSLHISAPSDEQCSQINGSAGSGGGAAGAAGSNSSGGANSGATNGWW